MEHVRVKNTANHDTNPGLGSLFPSNPDEEDSVSYSNPAPVCNEVRW